MPGLSIQLIYFFLEFVRVSSEAEACLGETNIEDGAAQVPAEPGGEDAGVGLDLDRDPLRLLHHPGGPALHHVLPLPEGEPWFPNIPRSFKQSGAGELCSQFLHLLPLQR